MTGTIGQTSGFLMNNDIWDRSRLYKELCEDGKAVLVIDQLSLYEQKHDQSTGVVQQNDDCVCWQVSVLRYQAGVA